MRAIIGSAIGVLAVGLILVGAGFRNLAAPPAQASYAPSATAMPAGQTVVPAADAIAGGAGAPVMVNCAPGQRTLVRQVLLNGQQVAQVACVVDPNAAFTNADAAAGSQMVRPVSYTTSGVSNLSGRRVVYQERAPRRVQREGRSWKKPLLVIGGSTAAGAGLGGIVGGKKGALIGAALGGGVSTLYEATRK